MPIKTVRGITYHTATTYMPGSHEKYTLGDQACIKHHLKAFGYTLRKHVGFNLYTSL